MVNIVVSTLLNDDNLFDTSALDDFALDLQSTFDSDSTDYEALLGSEPIEIAASQIAWQQGSTVLSLTGSGIGPISSLEELQQALEPDRK